MTIAASLIALEDIKLDRKSERPVYIQLVEQMRSLISEHRIGQGLKLPSSRELAEELNLSRKTVVSAHDQLIAEGYLEARRGAGTFVQDVSFLGMQPVRDIAPKSFYDYVEPSSFGEALPLSPSTPDKTQFPRTSWVRAAKKAQLSIPLSAMFAPPNGGYKPLREVLTNHLWSMRGIKCDPEQIIITSGMRESFSLVCERLFQKGRKVSVEAPGYQAFTETLKQNGLVPLHTKIDSDGLVFANVLNRSDPPQAVCVSASRQYPMGMPLSLQRRAELIRWASKSNGWIIEDDYDCEFRFAGPPLQSIFAMDTGHRTIYFGSLSKTLFPRLRLSFLVTPAHVASGLVEEQNRRGSLASLPSQASLSEFILSGQYATHIRTMRRLYADRYTKVFNYVNRELSEWLEVHPCSGGFHFAAQFRPKIADAADDAELVIMAHRRNVGVTALSTLGAPGGVDIKGFLIGFAGTDKKEARIAVSELRKLLSEHVKVS